MAEGWCRCSEQRSCWESGAPAALSDEQQRMVMVDGLAGARSRRWRARATTSASSASCNEAGVYVDDAGEARLRAEGYTIGETVEDATPTGARARPQIAAVDRRARRSRRRSPANGLTKAAKAKGAVSVAGRRRDQRAYTFTNYAGRFLYVEAHNKLHGDTTGPAMSFTYTGPNGTSQVVQPEQQRITPDGGDAAIGGNKLRDTDAGAGASTCTTAGWSRCAARTRTSPPADVTVRVADAHRRPRHGRRHRVGRQGAAAARRRASRRTSSRKYMDPTEIYDRMDALTAQFPDIIEAHRRCRARPDGYRRPAHGDDGGHHRAPTARRTRPDTPVGRVAVLEGAWATSAATTSPPSSRLPPPAR